jgi:hypothetical protein
MPTPPRSTALEDDAGAPDILWNNRADRVNKPNYHTGKLRAGMILKQLRQGIERVGDRSGL